MFSYILQRLLMTLLLLLSVATISFFLIDLIPGSPAEVMLQEGDCDALVIFLATVGLSAGNLFEKTKVILKDIIDQHPDALIACTKE